MTVDYEGEDIVQRERKYHSGWEWKIAGTPFSGTFGTGHQQRAMIVVMCNIIKDFNSVGWKLGQGGGGVSLSVITKDFCCFQCAAVIYLPSTTPPNMTGFPSVMINQVIIDQAKY